MCIAYLTEFLKEEQELHNRKQAVCYQKRGDFLCGLFGCFSFSSNSKKKIHASACLFYFVSFRKGFFLIYIYCLLNSFHYQDTSKVCPPHLAEWQKVDHEVLSCLNQSSICWKASSMLAKSRNSEMKKVVMGNVTLSSRYLCI